MVPTIDKERERGRMIDAKPFLLDGEILGSFRVVLTGLTVFGQVRVSGFSPNSVPCCDTKSRTNNMVQAID